MNIIIDADDLNEYLANLLNLEEPHVENEVYDFYFDLFFI
jgi:hypothetical protein